MRENYDVVIIGGGPAGISAAIYCKRANLDVCILDNYILGGNPNNYLEIENYPGLGKISTQELVDKFTQHLDSLNIPYKQFVNILNIDADNKIIKTEDEDLSYKYLIIATGSKPRKLNVPGEEEHIGKGVHYCAICDGALYKDKEVAVIGGGNSACEEALGLSKICKKVYIIEFTDKLNADRITLDKICNTKNILIYTNFGVTKITDLNEQHKQFYGVEGNKLMLEAQSVSSKQEPILWLLVDGIFPYIGMEANVPFIDIEKDNYGFIKVNENMETSIKDVYAIGDVTSKKYRQVVTAVADGAIAAISISKKGI